MAVALLGYSITKDWVSTRKKGLAEDIKLWTLSIGAVTIDVGGVVTLLVLGILGSLSVLSLPAVVSYSLIGACGLWVILEGIALSKIIKRSSD